MTFPGEGGGEGTGDGGGCAVDEGVCMTTVLCS